MSEPEAPRVLVLVGDPAAVCVDGVCAVPEAPDGVSE